MAFAFNLRENPKLAITGRQQKSIQIMFEEKAQRAAGGTSKKTPKAQKPPKVRLKNWTDMYAENPDGYDDLNIESAERVMPKGETEWREAKIVRSPLHEGIGELAEAAAPAEAEAEAHTRAGYEQSRGTIVEVASNLYTVETPEGRYLCSSANPCASSTAATATCWPWAIM